MLHSICVTSVLFTRPFCNSKQAQVRTARASSSFSRKQTAASFRQLTETLKRPEWTCWCNEAGVSGVLKWYRRAASRPQHADSPLTWPERYGEASVAVITRVFGLFPVWHLHSLGFPGQLEAVEAPASSAFHLGPWQPAPTLLWRIVRSQQALWVARMK